ncbi:MAG: hypothetical protein IPK63_03650 [Candidatus Competibacteraceae bacterium]|nr:hypothetical protein [Candidatus Competibacteraceae bacterium]
MAKLLLPNELNLNPPGSREPGIHGSPFLTDTEQYLVADPHLIPLRR